MVVPVRAVAPPQGADAKGGLWGPRRCLCYFENYVRKALPKCTVLKSAKSAVAGGARASQVPLKAVAAGLLT